MNKLALGAAGFLVAAIGASAFMLSGQSAPDRGAGTTSTLPSGNVPKNDQMTAAMKMRPAAARRSINRMPNRRVKVSVTTKRPR